MIFRLSREIGQLYPNLLVGLVAVGDARNSQTIPEIENLLRQAENSVRLSISEDNFKQHPYFSVWQDAHKLFGSNPNKFPPSHQALAKRVLKGGSLPSINPLVDLYNVISLKHLLPAGGEDLDSSVGEIRLDIADGSEYFIALGETEEDPPLPDEIVYKDDAGVICRRFNWREADRSKITAGTKRAVLVIESLVGMEKLDSALSELHSLVRKYCAEDVRMMVLSSGSDFVSI